MHETLWSKSHKFSQLMGYPVWNYQRYCKS